MLWLTDCESRGKEVHVDGQQGTDMTLCGFTLDGDPQVQIGIPIKVPKQKVTCPECLLIVEKVKQYIKWSKPT
jgi:hypothetical protein